MVWHILETLSFYKYLIEVKGLQLLNIGALLVE